MGIKRVRLNYQPVAKRKSNEIAYEVGNDHVIAVNRGLEEKRKRNMYEQQDHTDAGKFICKNKHV